MNPAAALGERIRRDVPATIRVPLTLVALALPIYWIATGSGLYRGIADLQVRWWGSYGVKLTAAYTGLAVIIPVLVLLAVIAVVRGPAPRAAATASGGGGG